MYGTVYRMRVRPGQEQAMFELTRRWNVERAPHVGGYIGEYIYRLDSAPQEYIGVVLFESREAYMKNADDPEQDRLYQEWRAFLESDPEWHDGEVVFTWPPGARPS